MTESSSELASGELLQQVRSKSPKTLREMEDADLIALCLDGSEDAWSALISRYQRLIYSIPMRSGLGEDKAADIFQSVCTRLIEHLGTLKDREKLASWLITTTNRECWRTVHRTRREAPIGEGGDAPLDFPQSEMADEQPLAEEVQMQLVEQQRLRSAVGALPDRCRSLIDLLYFQEDKPSYEEIARRLDMPVPSIGPTRARCLEKLKKLMV